METQESKTLLRLADVLKQQMQSPLPVGAESTPYDQVIEWLGLVKELEVVLATTELPPDFQQQLSEAVYFVLTQIKALVPKSELKHSSPDGYFRWSEIVKMLNHCKLGVDVRNRDLIDSHSGIHWRVEDLLLAAALSFWPDKQKVDYEASGYAKWKLDLLQVYIDVLNQLVALRLFTRAECIEPTRQFRELADAVDEMRRWLLAVAYEEDSDKFTQKQELAIQWDEQLIEDLVNHIDRANTGDPEISLESQWQQFRKDQLSGEVILTAISVTKTGQFWLIFSNNEQFELELGKCTATSLQSKLQELIKQLYEIQPDSKIFDLSRVALRSGEGLLFDQLNSAGSHTVLTLQTINGSHISLAVLKQMTAASVATQKKLAVETAEQLNLSAVIWQQARENIRELAVDPQLLKTNISKDTNLVLFESLTKLDISLLFGHRCVLSVTGDSRTGFRGLDRAIGRKVTSLNQITIQAEGHSTVPVPILLRFHYGGAELGILWSPKSNTIEIMVMPPAALTENILNELRDSLQGHLTDNEIFIKTWLLIGQYFTSATRPDALFAFMWQHRELGVNEFEQLIEQQYFQHAFAEVGRLYPMIYVNTGWKTDDVINTCFTYLWRRGERKRLKKQRQALRDQDPSAQKLDLFLGAVSDAFARLQQIWFNSKKTQLHGDQLERARLRLVESTNQPDAVHEKDDYEANHSNSDSLS